MLETVDQVIEALGGTSKVAEIVGVGLPAVSNAKKAGHIPYRWRMAIMQEVQRLELKITPELIGIDLSPARAETLRQGIG